MVRPTATDAADAPPLGQSPIDLTHVAVVGATYGPVRAAKVVVYLEDGRRLVLDLPASARPTKDWRKTKAGRAILDVLAGEGRAVKARTIAKLADLEYSGSFRQTLKGLVDQGEVVQPEDTDAYELA